MRRTLATRSALAAAAAGLAAAGLAAGAALAGGGGATKTVTVTLKEFKLVPSTTKLAAGQDDVRRRQPRQVPARARAQGGGERPHTAVIKPGATARFTVTLRNGSYTLWCPVGTHASAGMKLTFHVGAAAAAGGGGGATTSTPMPTTTDPGGYDPGGY